MHGTMLRPTKIKDSKAWPPKTMIVFQYVVYNTITDSFPFMKWGCPKKWTPSDNKLCLFFASEAVEGRDGIGVRRQRHKWEDKCWAGKTRSLERGQNNPEEGKSGTCYWVVHEQGSKGRLGGEVWGCPAWAPRGSSPAATSENGISGPWEGRTHTSAPRGVFSGLPGENAQESLYGTFQLSALLFLCYPGCIKAISQSHVVGLRAPKAIESCLPPLTIAESLTHACPGAQLFPSADPPLSCPRQDSTGPRDTELQCGGPEWVTHVVSGKPPVTRSRTSSWEFTCSTISPHPCFFEK